MAKRQKPKSGSVENMDEFTLKRWYALIIGVDMICKEAEKQNIPIANIDFKQNHLSAFVDSYADRIRVV